MEIFKTFTFDAAHVLPKVPKGHRCGQLHGHTYTVTIYIDGPIDSRSGWVLDFGDLKTLFKPILEQLDHKYLNDIKGLENPTTENLAKWIWKLLKPELPLISRIIVSESPTSGCIYRGEDE